MIRPVLSAGTEPALYYLELDSAGGESRGQSEVGVWSEEGACNISDDIADG
jgi:hypothetical protein